MAVSILLVQQKLYQGPFLQERYEENVQNISGKYVESIRKMTRTNPEHVLKIFGRCPEDICMDNVWKMSKKYMGNVWKISGKCFERVVSILQKRSLIQLTKQKLPYNIINYYIIYHNKNIILYDVMFQQQFIIYTIKQKIN